MRGGEEPGDDGEVFFRETEFGGQGAVDGEEGEPDEHTPGDGKEGIFRPDICHERRFPKHSPQNGRI